VDLYPGLVVWDDRVSGSITTGRSRLPLWCLVYTALTGGWDQVEHGWEPSQYGWDASRMGQFLTDLLELRGEFARLILVLADNERRERTHDMSGPPWWERPTTRRRTISQLKRCLEVLENLETDESIPNPPVCS
jgi:hypothetical protein